MVVLSTYIGMVVYAKDTLECFDIFTHFTIVMQSTLMYTCTNDWYVPIFIQYTIYTVIQYTIYTINMYTCMNDLYYIIPILSVYCM